MPFPDVHVHNCLKSLFDTLDMELTGARVLEVREVYCTPGSRAGSRTCSHQSRYASMMLPCSAFTHPLNLSNSLPANMQSYACHQRCFLTSLAPSSSVQRIHALRKLVHLLACATQFESSNENRVTSRD